MTSTTSGLRAVPGVTRRLHLQRPESLPAMLVTLVGAGVVIAYWRLVGFSTFASDAKSYWLNSEHWDHPVDPFHLPAYPFTVAVVRGATGGGLAPTYVMTLITLVAVLAGVAATYALAHEVHLSRRASLAAASAFGLWPFVGVVYTALPVSDPMALAALLWGATFLLRERVVPAGLALGCAAMTHKGLWPTIGLIVIGQLLVVGRRRAGIAIGAIAAAPVLALWLDGVATGQLPSWLFRSSAEDATQATGPSLHYLDGLVGGLIYGDRIARDRAIVVIGVVALAVALVVLNVPRWRAPAHLVFAVFAAQIVFMSVTLNQHLIWASVRFSGLLAVPAAWAVSGAIDRCEPGRWRALAAGVGLALVATQVLTAAAIARHSWGAIL